MTQTDAAPFPAPGTADTARSTGLHFNGNGHFKSNGNFKGNYNCRCAYFKNNGNGNGNGRCAYVNGNRRPCRP
ncbi:hypothetical protein ABC383_05680 [Noviherbaspirillum sp. 1P10PC]|uniref:hypothetical protein n=1 Tax=Noviherbaspirillum sp. 1P10PC TaxID=3132292 RepID=UPI00399F157D